jgi:hypothetical protein
MSAGHVKGFSNLGSLYDLLRGIELSRLLRVADIADVQQIGRGRKPIDFVERQIQCSGYIMVGSLVESDVAVADLYEAEACGCVCGLAVCRAGGRGKESGGWYASGHGPKQTGSCAQAMQLRKFLRSMPSLATGESVESSD